MSKRICDGTCKKFRVSKPTGAGRYASGQCRCQICDIWMDYKGCHLADNTPATADSEGWYCNCCNYRVRRKPRNIEYKEKLRSSDSTGMDSSEDKSDTIDFSYFSKRRAGMMKKMAICILKKGVESSPQNMTYNLIHDFALPEYDIEQEFDGSIEELFRQAHILDPPNKMSMILEFERVKSVIGDVPTKMEFQKHSGLELATYETEFQSWEKLLDRLGYDPWYRKEVKLDKNDERFVQYEEDSPIDKLEKRKAELEAELGELKKEKERISKPKKTKEEIAHRAVAARRARNPSWGKKTDEADRINRLIDVSLKLIKTKPDGTHASEIMESLEISQDEMRDLIPRLARIDGITKENNGKMTNVLFEYRQPVQNEDTEAKYAPNNTNQTVKEIAEYMVNEHAANKTNVAKHLRQRLTREFVESRSMLQVIRNNPQIQKEKIMRHVITSLRLPEELKEMENEGVLHPDPECSLQIALFAVNIHEWDGGDDAHAVTGLAVSISKYLIVNKNLDQLFRHGRFIKKTIESNPTADTTIPENMALNSIDDKTIPSLKKGDVLTEKQLQATFGVRYSGGIRPSNKNRVVIIINSTYSDVGYQNTKEDGCITHVGEGQEDQEMTRNNRSLMLTRQNGYKLLCFDKVAPNKLVFQGTAEYADHTFEERPNYEGRSRRAILFKLKMQD